MEKDISAKMDDARTFLARKILNVNGIFFLDRFNKNGSFFLQDFSCLFFSQSDGAPKTRAANSKVYFNVIRSVSPYSQEKVYNTTVCITNFVMCSGL